MGFKGKTASNNEARKTRSALRVRNEACPAAVENDHIPDRGWRIRLSLTNTVQLVDRQFKELFEDRRLLDKRRS